jgi:hypothetical protein
MIHPFPNENVSSLPDAIPHPEEQNFVVLKQ